ncbi:MAG: glycosyltransferase [Lachnospiraceae bacterium]|nr:glycosyltransferase [Lachnospiraceae bacterium]
MKIMFHLNCLEQGGAERVVSNLSNQLSADGHEVIVATEWIGENEFSLVDEVTRVVVGPRKEDENKSRITKAWLRLKYLRNQVKKDKPDVVIAFDHKASYRALAACKFVKVPVIVSVRTDPVGHYDGKKDKILIPLLYPRADGCVFQTQGQKEFFPMYLQKKSTIILNPLNPKYVGVRRSENPSKTVVTHGRLVDFKNQAMMIKAFCRVHDKHPDYDLKIYGPDSFDGTKEILESIIEEKNAAEFVHLMGGSDSLEIEVPKCEVYAFSSDWEGLPNALLEAMAMGMPIVATDCPCGGPRTVMVNGQDGLLIPIKNEDALVEGMLRLIEDKELATRLGENATKIVERINSQAIQDEWVNYIRRVVENYRKL